MLSFSVMDDLKEASKVLNDFINKADTEEKIEKAISLMADSIKNGGKSFTSFELALSIAYAPMRQNWCAPLPQPITAWSSTITCPPRAEWELITI